MAGIKSALSGGVTMGFRRSASGFRGDGVIAPGICRFRRGAKAPFLHRGSAYRVLWRSHAFPPLKPDSHHNAQRLGLPLTDVKQAENSHRTSGYFEVKCAHSSYSEVTS